MARMINYGDDELLANPFAFAAQAPVAPAMLAPVSAPVAAAQAPTAREMMNGVGRDGQVSPLSQTQGYGMVPVYQAQQGRGPEREGERGLLGYEFNPIAAGLTTVDVPKPPAILAEEKRIGKPMEATYATFTAPREGSETGNRESVAYGPPIGYRYDNGQGQYVKFYSDGNYYETEQRKGEYDDALKAAALFAAIASGGASLGLGEASLLGETAVLGGVGEATALTAEQIAAANAASYAANAAKAIPSLGELVASGTLPGSVGALNFSTLLANPAALDAAYGLLSQTPLITPPFPSGPPSTPGTPPPPNLETGLLSEPPIPAGPPSTPGTPPPPNLELPPPIDAPIPSGPPSTPGTPPPPDVGPPGTNLEPPIPSGPPSTPGTPPPPDVGPPGSNIPFELPSLSTIKDALTVASLVSGAVGNNNASTAAPFTMAPYVPPSGRPFANLGMSPIAAPYTPTRILGQYDPTMTPGGVSPYELIMQQMQAPKNLYADFEAGTNIGGYDPQRFVVPPAAAAAALPNNMGGMIDKSRMVGPNPMGPDNGFASIQDGEFVMNRKATAKYGIELMNAINSGKISKGKLSGLLEA